MEDALSPSGVRAVRATVGQLVRGEYALLRSKSSAQELRTAVLEYGRTLEIPPDPFDQWLNVVRVTAAERPTWYVAVSLWSVEEGRSDLTLELEVVASSAAEHEVEVTGLHVL